MPKAIDKHFRTYPIDTVSDDKTGWVIHTELGCLNVPKTPRAPAPKVGDAATFYFSGSTVRGLIIAGYEHWYRTEKEEEQRHNDMFYPQTAKAALARWDAGESIFTVEMGGLGPGYEQAIHVLAFELIRDYLDKSVPTEKEWSAWGDATVGRLDHIGFSGAQVGAAKKIAFMTLKDGWQATFLGLPSDRRIQVSKSWPRAEKTA